MKNTSSLVVTIFLVAAVSGIASAEERVVKAGPTISVDANVAIPVGDLADVAGLGFGPTGTFNFPLNQALTVTGRAGLIYHLKKTFSNPLGDDVNTGILALPLLGGVKYSIGKVYVGGELGLFHVRATGDGEGTSTDLGLTAGVGYRIGKIDLRGGLQIYDLLGDSDADKNLTDSMTLFLTAGYTVAGL